MLISASLLARAEILFKQGLIVLAIALLLGIIGL